MKWVRKVNSQSQLRTNRVKKKINLFSCSLNSMWRFWDSFIFFRSDGVVIARQNSDFLFCSFVCQETTQPLCPKRSILRSVERCELIWNLLSLGHCFLSMKNSLSNGSFQNYNSFENRRTEKYLPPNERTLRTTRLNQLLNAIISVIG